MASAKVGDDVFGDDSTVNALEERVADMLGTQSAIQYILISSGKRIRLVTHLDICADDIGRFVDELEKGLQVTQHSA
jgi:threonine aldolase